MLPASLLSQHSAMECTHSFLLHTQDRVRMFSLASLNFIGGSQVTTGRSFASSHAIEYTHLPHRTPTHGDAC